MISIYKLQNVSPYCLIKQVNKILGIRNSGIWLFDDVSKIVYWHFISYFEQIKQMTNFHGKNSGSVFSEFVKTYDELLIDVEKDLVHQFH